MLTVAIKYLLGLNHFGQPSQDREHVPTVSPSHEVEVHFVKNRTHAFDTAPNIISHLDLRCPSAGLLPIAVRFSSRSLDSSHLGASRLTMHLESVVSE